MQIVNSTDLKSFHTFQLKSTANRIILIESESDLEEYFKKPSSKWLVIGSGSNVLFNSHFDGDVLLIKFTGSKIVSKNETNITIDVLAGTDWHNFVTECVDSNYSGIENLALIPGTVGAAPIQNIGAYGVEVKDVIESVTYFDVIDLTFKTLENHDCNFGYRDSIFKNELKGRVVICSVRFKLNHIYHQLQLSYEPVAKWLADKNINNPTIKDIYSAVISIRHSKLPDPKEIGNAGSFFKNPITESQHLAKLQETYPTIPFYTVDELSVKIPAGWLIEQTGWKGYREGDIGVFPKQALVLVNYGNAHSDELIDLSNRIIDSVHLKFGIVLHPEVNIIR